MSERRPEPRRTPRRVPLRVPRRRAAGPRRLVARLALPVGFALAAAAVVVVDPSSDEAAAPVDPRLGVEPPPAGGAGGAPALADGGGEGGAAVASRYRVRPGDTLASIAALHGMELAAVARTNGSTPPHVVRSGQWLRIPMPGPGRVDPPTPPETDAEAVRTAIERWSTANDLPPALLAAVLWQESRWRPGARSSAGAVGVGQLLPSTARWVSAELVGHPLDPAEVDDGVRLSARFLRWLLDTTGGDQAAAVAAYYQGLAGLRADGWYDETERYVAAVFGYRWRFAGDRWR